MVSHDFSSFFFYDDDDDDDDDDDHDDKDICKLYSFISLELKMIETSLKTWHVQQNLFNKMREH